MAERSPRPVAAPDRPVFGADTTIDRYVDMLISEGIKRGLLGPREAPRIWDRHVWNCAVIEAEVPGGAVVCDVGSGAGLPGVVLAIARPDLDVTLLEPLLRRTTFLSEVAAELHLSNVTVVRGRADAGVDGHTYDVVTARAVAPLVRLAGECRSLCRVGTMLLALKGRSAAEELADAQRELTRQGWGAGSVRALGLGIVEPLTTIVRIEFEGPDGTDKNRAKGGAP